MKAPAAARYQAIVRAPTFSIGVRCDEMEIHALDYLKPCAEIAPTNALAAEARHNHVDHLTHGGPRTFRRP